MRLIPAQGSTDMAQRGKTDLLLEVKNLHTQFKTERGIVHAVNGVSFSVEKGTILGIVGESGCGKSVASLSILRLIAEPPGKITEGSILFEGRDLLRLSEQEIIGVRGNEIAMIFQEPMTSLNPVYTIGAQIGEAVRIHQQVGREAARKKSIEMLKLVGIPRAEEVVDEYPHRFSGGMRQRVMIAMAVSCSPKLLIADEPTTALDVTIQAQILELMKDLRDRIGTAVMFITHDLGVIAEMADHVVVMYAGRVVEKADIHALFAEPKHPYTEALLHAKPRIEEDLETLVYIPGNVPNPLDMPPGCPFHPRCSRAMEVCTRTMPSETISETGHLVACWLYHRETEFS